MTSGDLGSPAGPSRNTPDEGADGALVALSGSAADGPVSGAGDRDLDTDRLPERAGRATAPTRDRGAPPSRLSTWRLLVVVLVLAALIRALVLQIFFIPSSSMMPTLAPGDRIAVEKVTLRFEPLARTDVVVFQDPTPDTDVSARPLPVRALWEVAAFIGVPDPGHTALVKRVIGLPGETIEIDGQGGLMVGGVRIDEPYVQNVQRRPFGPVTVPMGKLLVLGDNRPGSDDSRGTLGFVDEDLVIGRVAGIIWPLGRTGALGDDAGGSDGSS